MDRTNRQITKIARVAQRVGNESIYQHGLGPTEFECLRSIQKQEGCNQAFLQERLAIDRAAVARIVANLEKKGLVTRTQDPHDKRANNLFTTAKASGIKEAESSRESRYYEWLQRDLPQDELAAFLSVLDQIYQRSKQDRREGFTQFDEWLASKQTAAK